MSWRRTEAKQRSKYMWVWLPADAFGDGAIAHENKCDLHQICERGSPNEFCDMAKFDRSNYHSLKLSYSLRIVMDDRGLIRGHC